MKIVFLARRFSPDIGGVEKHVFEVGKRLVKEGNQVSVITQSPGYLSELSGIKIIRMKASGKKAIWKWILKNRNLFKEADVVHAHDVYFWYFPLRLIYPSKKSYVTFHGYESYPIKKRAIFMRKISELASSGNIIVGEFIKKWYRTNPNFIIYGGVDVPDKIKKPKFKNSALFFGRLDDQTGILEYANAVDIVRQKHPEFKFKVVGEGEYQKQLKRYHPVAFTNELNKEFEIYNFSFVSRYLSILESFANKRLVFAFYDDPVKEDYLKMSPFSKFMIIEKSSLKMADKVGYFLDNPQQARQMLDDAYNWAAKNSWEKVVSVYLKLWNL